MTRLKVLRSRIPFPLIAVLFMALVVMPVMLATPARADLCAEQPMPENPWNDQWSRIYAPPVEGGNISIDPPSDPFEEDSTTRLSQWYGTRYQIVAYDASCNWGTDAIFTMRSEGESSIFNLSGIPFALANGVSVLAIQPDWRESLDGAVQEVTSSLGSGMWASFAGLAITLAAVVALWFAKGGDFPRVATQALWVFVVIGIAGVSITNSSYLTDTTDEATDLVVTTAAQTVPGGPEEKDESETKSVAVSNVLGNLDAINRDVLYRGWAEAQFGSADGVAATKHGESFYKATHLTWWEGRTVMNDPEGKGQEIIDTKKQAFKDTMSAIEKEDPQAFEYIKGKNTSRTGTVIMTLLQTYLTLPFYIIAMAAVGVALMTVRLAVMLLPIIAMAGLLEQTRPWFLGILQKYSGNLVKAPLAFCGALINVAIVGALFRSGLPAWSKLFLAVVMMVLLWGLFKPQVTPIPIARKGFSLARRAGTYLAGMAAGRAARPRDDADDSSSRNQAPSDPPPGDGGGGSSQRPVAGSEARTLPTGRGRPKELPAAPTATTQAPPARAAHRAPEDLGYVPVVVQGPAALPPAPGDRAPESTSREVERSDRTADERYHPAAGTTGSTTRGTSSRPIDAWVEEHPSAPSETTQRPDEDVRVVYTEGRTPRPTTAPNSAATTGTAGPTAGTSGGTTDGDQHRSPGSQPREQESSMVAGYERVQVRDSGSRSEALTPDGVWVPPKKDAEDGEREGVSESNLRRKDGKAVFPIFTPGAAGDRGRTA